MSKITPGCSHLHCQPCRHCWKVNQSHVMGKVHKNIDIGNQQKKGTLSNKLNDCYMYPFAYLISCFVNFTVEIIIEMTIFVEVNYRQRLGLLPLEVCERKTCVICILISK